jgi:GNAT superfamily N-acetyltransferase
MTDIRAASLRDLPQLVELGRVMHAESPRLGKLTLDELKLKATLAGLMSSATGLLLVAEDEGKLIGGIAAVITEHWYSHDKMAYDLAVFVRPDKRGGILAARLINAYAAWARDHGAVITQIGISTGVNVDTTGAMLEHLGYTRSGLLYDV